MNSYETKLKQFTNKFPDKTREQLEKHMDYVRETFQKQDGTVKERYRRYLDLLEERNEPAKPSYTAYTYVCYYKHNFDLHWLQFTLVDTTKNIDWRIKK